MADMDVSALRAPKTNGQKWLVALVLAILFAVIASTPVYQLTNKLLTSIFGPRAATLGPNGPTVFGLILHAIVFGLIVRLLLY